MIHIVFFSDISLDKLYKLVDVYCEHKPKHISEYCKLVAKTMLSGTKCKEYFIDGKGNKYIFECIREW